MLAFHLLFYFCRVTTNSRRFTRTYTWHKNIIFLQRRVKSLSVHSDMQWNATFTRSNISTDLIIMFTYISLKRKEHRLSSSSSPDNNEGWNWLQKNGTVEFRARKDDVTKLKNNLVFYVLILFTHKRDLFYFFFQLAVVDVYVC